MIHFRFALGKRETLNNIQSSFDGEAWINGTPCGYESEFDFWLANNKEVKMSILGKHIQALQTEAMEKHVPIVINRWLELAKDCGEYGNSGVSNFVAYFDPTEEDVWESLCVITDVYDAKYLEEVVGIVVHFPQSTQCVVKWSGK